MGSVTDVDAQGKRLTDYPRPSVAVDTALLTLPPDGPLSVVLVKDSTDGDWRLPGTFLHVGETLAAAVQRSLKVKAGVTGRSPTQLQVFDDPQRDNRGWVLSVAHLDAVPFADLKIDPAQARLTPIAAIGQLKTITTRSSTARSTSYGRATWITPIPQVSRGRASRCANCSACTRPSTTSR